MSRVFTRTSKRLNGQDRTDTVRVEACPGKVLVTSQDESATPHLDRRASDDPARLVGEIAEDLRYAGYDER